MEKYEKNSAKKKEFSVVLNSMGYPAFWDFEFNYFKKPIKNLIPYSRISLPQLAEVVKSPRFKKTCEDLRKIKEESEQRAFKAKHFDYVCISGTFSKRESASLVMHSNLICIDLDKIDVPDVKAQLINNPETVMIFTSPSGTGLKWITQIDSKKYSHLEWYLGIEGYLLDKYNLKPDKACKDVCRACFVSYDPDVYLNPNFA